MLFNRPLQKIGEIRIEIEKVSYKKGHLKMSSAKWQKYCLGFNVLTHWGQNNYVGHIAGIFKYTFVIFKCF